jgi:hypothetical protein
VNLVLSGGYTRIIAQGYREDIDLFSFDPRPPRLSQRTPFLFAVPGPSFRVRREVADRSDLEGLAFPNHALRGPGFEGAEDV